MKTNTEEEFYPTLGKKPHCLDTGIACFVQGKNWILHKLYFRFSRLKIAHE